jgi:hypothetical protein
MASSISGGHDVEVAVLPRAPQACLVDVHEQADPSFIVTASGLGATHPAGATGEGERCRPGCPLNRLSATAAKVSKVHCRMPWVPM